MVELVEGLQVDVIRRRLGQRPRDLQLELQLLADVLRVFPEGIEPLVQRPHLGVAGHTHVELGVAAEAGQCEVRGADDRRSWLSVVAVPAEIRLGVKRALSVRPHLRLARGDHVAQRSNGVLRLSGLRQQFHAFRDAANGILCDGEPVAPLHKAVGIQSRLESVGLLQSRRDHLNHLTVGAADENADLVELGQLGTHRAETRHEEVADGDVRSGGAVEHLPQAGEEVRVGGCMEDVHAAA